MATEQELREMGTADFAAWKEASRGLNIAGARQPAAPALEEVRDPSLPPDDPADPSLFAFTDAGRRLWRALFAMGHGAELDDLVRVRCGDLHAAVATLDAVERGVYRRSTGTATMPTRDPAVGAAVLASAKRLGWLARVTEPVRRMVTR